MYLNSYGKELEKNIHETSIIRKEVLLDSYIIMPNHVHILISVANAQYDGNASGPHACGPYGERMNIVGNAGMRSAGAQGRKKYSKNIVSNYIQGIKSSYTKNIREKYGDYEFAWQKSFYDVIVRNEQQLEKTREYIIQNPEKWEQDINNISKEKTA